MYPADFPSEPPLLIDPTLLVALILAMIVLMIISFAAGRQVGGRRRLGDSADVPKTIHKAIAKRAAMAAAAPSNLLVAATSRLVEEINTRLGAAVALGAPTGKYLKAMVDALKAEADPEEAKRKAAEHAAHGGGHGGGHGAAHTSHDAHGEHEGEAHEDEEEGEYALLEALNTPTINIKTKGPIIFASDRSRKGKKPAPEPHHPPEELKDPSYKDAIRAVRQAVADFSDHWSRSETLRDLERLQKQMLETPDLPKDPRAEEH
jgi:hypothetical protein